MNVNRRIQIVLSLTLLVSACAGRICFCATSAPSTWRATGSSGSHGRRPPAIASSWRRSGWSPALPHAYLLVGSFRARRAPSYQSRVTGVVKGGERVEIMEQGAEWWRVISPHHVIGWLPRRMLEPHAAWVLIDLASGRMVNRYAAKGQNGAIEKGGAFWSVADSGLTRTVLGSRASSWSNPIVSEPRGDLSLESAWSPSGNSLVMWTGPRNGRRGLVQVNTCDGAVTPLGVRMDMSQRPLRLGAAGELLTCGSGNCRLAEPRSGKLLGKFEGNLVALGKEGEIYTAVGKQLRCYDERGNSLSRVNSSTRPEPVAGCVSTDGRTLGVVELTGGNSYLHLYRARTLREVSVIGLKPPETFSTPSMAPVALIPVRTGWYFVSSGEGDSGDAVQHYSSDGRLLHTWTGQVTAVAPDGGRLFLSDPNNLVELATTTGKSRIIPLTWRQHLPLRYLPHSDGIITHRQTTSMTLLSDGRTLLLFEWLDGDPKA